MNTEDFKQWGQHYSEDPSEKAWDRITNKMDASKALHRTDSLNWKMFGIAGCMILLLTWIGWSSYSSQSSSTKIYAYNVNQDIVKLEELNFESQDIQYYSLTDIETLSKAYEKLKF